jgi:hypothetical protein
LDDGDDIFGTPPGFLGFVDDYISGKGLKHKLLVCFIKEVADARF